MASFDIFNDDAFSVSTLTQTITDIPRVATRIGSSGLFTERGMPTLGMMVEREGSSLKLVPAQVRGSVGEPVKLGPRTMVNLPTVHLPQRGSMLADEVQGIRAFGKETEVEAASARFAQKLGLAKSQIDITMEYHRIGAIKGQVLDADGTTVLLDVYSAFGMTQQTKFFVLGTAGTKVKQKCVELKRMIQAKLGGRSFTKVRVLCSESFFDDLVGHATVEKAYELYNQNSHARTDQTGTGFEFADVIFEVYAGGIGTTEFIPDGLAYAYPEGVSNLFQTWYAPADWMETVNTLGLPYYAKQEVMPYNKGVSFESQSNPLNFCSLPEVVIECSAAAS